MKEDQSSDSAFKHPSGQISPKQDFYLQKHLCYKLKSDGAAKGEKIQLLRAH